jgi:hypothetical protein
MNGGSFAACRHDRVMWWPQGRQGDEMHMSDDPPFPPGVERNLLFNRVDGTVGTLDMPVEWSDSAHAIALDEKHEAMPSSRTLNDLLHMAGPLDGPACRRS